MLFGFTLYRRDGGFIFFASADAVERLQWLDEHLSVANRTEASSFGNSLDRRLDEVVGDSDVWKHLIISSRLRWAEKAVG